MVYLHISWYIQKFFNNQQQQQIKAYIFPFTSLILNSVIRSTASLFLLSFSLCYIKLKGLSKQMLLLSNTWNQYSISQHFPSRFPSILKSWVICSCFILVSLCDYIHIIEFFRYVFRVSNRVKWLNIFIKSFSYTLHFFFSLNFYYFDIIHNFL